MLQSVLRSAVLAACVLGGVAAASAATVAEVGDAGESLLTAQALPAGTTQVTGAVTANNADMFKFGWAGGNFDVNTNGSPIDTQLFLFDSFGFGIRADDDSGDGFNSLLSIANLAAGAYFLAVTEYGYEPSSPAGFIFPEGGENVGPTGLGGGQALSGWGQRAAEGAGDYVINFRVGTSIIPGPNDRPLPEPHTLMLVALGLLGAAAIRKRRGLGA
jgi:hypothetical protein